MDAVLIGAGMVAQTHILALRDNTEGVRLRGVVGRDMFRTEAFCLQASAILGYPVAASADKANARAPAPDMAIQITPPHARAAFS
ncbi:MAG: Gfo/Idh/MocA family oxidoreductase, partial [Pseudomonadota bacterium]